MKSSYCGRELEAKQTQIGEEAMTRRERLIATFEDREVDRIPVSTYELDAFDNERLRRDSGYRRLLDRVEASADLFYPWGPRVVSEGLGHFLTATEEVVSERKIHEEGEATVTVTTVRAPKGTLRQVRRSVPGLDTTWQTEHFLKTDADIETLLSIPYVPQALDCSSFQEVDERIGEKGLLHISLPDPLCVVAELFEFGEFTVRAMTETERIERLLDLFWVRIRAYLQAILDAGVTGVFRICGPEYATPPYLPPEKFHAYVVPYVKEMNRMIEKVGGYSRFHCHGKIGNVLDSILETEPHALEPLEPPPDGDISLEELVARAGEQVVLMGNIETRELEFLGEDEMRCRVREALRVGRQASRGFVLLPTACPTSMTLSPATERNYEIFLEEPGVD